MSDLLLGSLAASPPASWAPAPPTPTSVDTGSGGASSGGANSPHSAKRQGPEGPEPADVAAALAALAASQTAPAAQQLQQRARRARRVLMQQQRAGRGLMGSRGRALAAPSAQEEQQEQEEDLGWEDQGAPRTKSTQGQQQQSQLQKASAAEIPEAKELLPLPATPPDLPVEGLNSKPAHLNSKPAPGEAVTEPLERAPLRTTAAVARAPATPDTVADYPQPVSGAVKEVRQSNGAAAASELSAWSKEERARAKAAMPWLFSPQAGGSGLSLEMRELYALAVSYCPSSYFGLSSLAMSLTLSLRCHAMIAHAASLGSPRAGHLRHILTRGAPEPCAPHPRAD